jgi:Histidine kinase-, DNA gyrase B-, and HSP90-like ATPase
MKPLNDTMTARSTLGGETRAMSIDADATAHLMGLLSNIYTDPIAAVIREYATNGYDATIEAGCIDPVLVTLPSHTDPNLRIQDFGVGMSTDKVLDHYSLYGRSDKRETNDQVGMLGIGCKSALTYSPQFSIESVYNGIRTIALVAKNAEGVGEIEIIDTVSTTERNGTTITIPVKAQDVWNFQTEAQTIFSYWPAGSVLVDGKAPESAFGGLHQIPGQEVWYAGSGYNGHVVLMGNVAYKCDSDLLKDFRNTPLIIKASIGDVSFAPSREELFYNVRTNDYLRRKVVEIKDAVRAEIDAFMASATTKPEAFAMRGRNEHFSFLSDVKWEYGTETVPPYIVGNGSLIWTRDAYPYDNAKAGTRWQRKGADDTTVYIKNYPYTSVSKRVKQGLAQWSDDTSHAFAGKRNFILASSEASEWVEWYDWNDYKGDLPKMTTGTGTRYRAQRSTLIIDHNAYVYQGGDRASDYPDAEYFVITPEELREGTYPNLRSMIAVKVKPVLVYKRDVDTFREDFATVDRAEIKDRLAKADAARTDEQYLARAVKDNSVLQALGKHSLLDPALNDLLATKVDGSLEWTVNVSMSRSNKAIEAVSKALLPYPLLPSYWYNGSGKTASLADYVNALYTYKEGK